MQEEQRQQWGIVELMGHKLVAGLICEDEMLGTSMLRVDVPATSKYPGFTQFYGANALYCVTFTSEEVARITAEDWGINPIGVYLPQLITVEQYHNDIERLKEELRQARAALPSGETHIPDDDFDIPF